jgi:hypothetical protein
MAKFPYTVGLAKVDNGDGTSTLTLTITNGNGVVVKTVSNAKMANTTPIGDVVQWARGVARDNANQNISLADLPANVSLTLDPLWLAGD